MKIIVTMLLLLSLAIVPLARAEDETWAMSDDGGDDPFFNHCLSISYGISAFEGLESAAPEVFKVLRWDRALDRERKGYQIKCLGGETGITLSILVKEKRVGRDEACLSFKRTTWGYVSMVEDSMSYRFPDNVILKFGRAVTFGVRAIAGIPGCKAISREWEF